MIEVAQLDTEPEPCPYLPGREARTRYQLVADLLPSEYDEKLEKGWRRFGSILFSGVGRIPIFIFHRGILVLIRNGFAVG